MPTEPLRVVKKNGHVAVERQAPEPLNRVMRRELVRDRRLTKQELKRCMAEPQTVTE